MRCHIDSHINAIRRYHEHFNDYMYFKVKCSYSGPILSAKSFDPIKRSVHRTMKCPSWQYLYIHDALFSQASAVINSGFVSFEVIE